MQNLESYNFERFIWKRKRSYNPFVFINSTLQIVLNTKCVLKYFKKGENEFAELYFNKEKFTIGIKPFKEKTYSCFKISRRSPKYPGGLISGAGFFNHYNISCETNKRYYPTWNDKEKMLIIKLQKPEE